MRKDKAKIIDEVWNDDRIRLFLDRQAPTGVEPDFHALLMAYRSMRLTDFDRFIELFVQANRNLEATGPDGQTLAHILARHRHAGPFAAVLDRAKSASATGDAGP